MNVRIVSHPDSRVSHEVELRDGTWSVVERARYHVQSDDIAELSFGGRMLPRETNGFLLELSFWCGRARLDAILHDGTRASIALDVRADPNKLDDLSWERMLDDIDARWPGRTLGIEGGLHGSSVDEGIADLLALLPLLSNIDSLMLQLRDLVAALRTRDVVRQEHVPLRSLRRIDASTARWIAQHPRAASALIDQERDEDRLQRTLVEQRLRHASFDHPANRALRWLIERVRARLDELASILARRERELSANWLTDASSWCKLRRETAERAARSLRAFVDESELAAVVAEPPGAAAMQTIANDALYERVFRRCRRWIAPRFQREGDGEAGVSIKSSFELYERWCLVHLERELAVAFEGLTWSEGATEHGPARCGAGAGVRVWLYDNLVFSHWRDGADRYAIISERTPDFVVAIEREGVKRWVILDAKYRSHALSVREALDEIALYRASLRWEAFGGECAAAAILVPTVGVGAERWAREVFVERFAFGAIVARPGGEATIGRWLKAWVIARMACHSVTQTSGADSERL
jgi:hypothetical protein